MFISYDDVDSGKATIADKRTECGLSKIENTDILVTTNIFDNKMDQDPPKKNEETTRAKAEYNHSLTDEEKNDIKEIIDYLDSL
ncbi:hypothetical protein [Hungatella hathewayi]|uniref:hypothetical protein n=1 Tax=Hungatella hathewayi TaxID=154046 RepID=UPI003569F245